MKSLRQLAFVVLLAILVPCGMLFAQGSVLHMYTALDPNEAKIYIDAFQKDTGIQVEWVRLSAGEVLTRLKAEAKRPQVSVWFGGSAIEFIAGKNAGLLLPYQSPAANFLKDDLTLRDKDWQWTGFYFGAIGWGVNTTWFDEKKLPYPTSWADLIKPEYKGFISIAYPYTSGTSFTTLVTLITLFGEDKAFDYWKKLDLNMHHYNTSGSAAVTQTGLGEVGIGISFSHDILAKGISKGYPMKMFFPSEGTGYEIGALALVKGGAEPENGQKFIDWCLSARAQNLMKAWFRIPLNPDAEIVEGAVKAADVKLIEFDNEWVGANNARINEKWRQLLGK